MIDFFKEGGWSMWAILFLGVVLLVSAGRYAARPEKGRASFLGGMTLSMIFAIGYGTWTDLASVFDYLSDKNKCPDGEITRTLFQGLKESTRPGTFGGAILMITALLFAVGLLRRSRVDEA